MAHTRSFPHHASVGCIVAVVAILGCVSACASARGRLERGLVDAGVAPVVASCMADQMDEQLSLAQMRKLGDLRRLDDDATSLDEFLANVRALRDPEILAVTSAAGAICWALVGRGDHRP